MPCQEIVTLITDVMQIGEEGGQGTVDYSEQFCAISNIPIHCAGVVFEFVAVVQ